MAPQQKERMSPIPFVLGVIVVSFVMVGYLPERSYVAIGERHGQGKATTERQYPTAEHGKADQPGPAPSRQNQNPSSAVQEADCKSCTEAEKADLREQRSMAKAAERQLWLSFGGLVAIVLSLAFTGWAAFAATRAAHAAEASVQVARETSQRQLRAYIDVDQAEITSRDEFGQLAAGVRLKNSGQTPAYDVECWYVIGWRPYPFLPGSFDPRRDREGESKATIGGGGGGTTLLLETVKVPPLSTDTDYLAGKLAIVVYGEVSYRDTFGNKQSTGFRMYNINDIGQRRLRKSPEGNHST